MGTVFAARDSRLDRDVALKLVRAGHADPEARERLLREAKAAAKLNHPNVCQIFEAGELDGEPFIAMELLEGEPLASRLERGALPAAEALGVLQGVLAALDAMHRRGIVHRDLKPANIFVTPHGVKVLDFGLARPTGIDDDKTRLQLTRPGMALGTPRYMSPEQWAGEPAGPACDLFAAGAVLFEMLAGRPAFNGASLPDVCRAIVNDRPPALTGGPMVCAADRIIARALAKRAADRWPSAESMSAAVRAALASPETGSAAARPARAVTRLAALPLKVLRPDAETDFLAVSLPDEVANSLAGLDSIVVRSPAAAAKAAGDPPDFAKLAADLDVDTVLAGTLMRAGDSIRVASQLLELPKGTVTWSRSTTAKLGDLFALQDDLARQIVDALKVQLSPREQRLLGHDVPASPAAYEKYLKANRVQISLTQTSALREAQTLYEASLGDDPSFAPAWARLGRIYRIQGKYELAPREEMMRKAGEAFRKALSLNPDLPIAHNHYTNYEVEELGRTREALERLLDRAKTGTADPQLYVGLCYVLRYAGLLDASIAADERARRLDPTIRTGVHYTFFFKGDLETAAARETDHPPIIRMRALCKAGRIVEGVALMQSVLDTQPEGIELHQITGAIALVEGRPEVALAEMTKTARSTFRDPEGLYFTCIMAGEAGGVDLCEELFVRTVEGGFFCVPAFEREAALASLKGRPRFEKAMELARARHREAVEVFARAGGPKILGTFS
jgi:non-specific serine/threonine protein kinase